MTRTAVPKKKKAPSIAKLKKTLWERCKVIVRKRYQNSDGSWNCYTCSLRITNPQDAHTAHFIASSICGVTLRYSLDNLRVCCGGCNVWKSGNWPAYYEHMVQEVGLEKVEELMRRRNDIGKGDRFFYQSLVDNYTELLTEML